MRVGGGGGGGGVGGGGGWGGGGGGGGGEGGYVSFSFSSGIVLDVLVLEKTALGEMIPVDNASTITCQ